MSLTVPTKTVHGILHVECLDCGDWQPHYDVVERTDGHFCRRCADVREAPVRPATPSGIDAETLHALLRGRT